MDLVTRADKIGHYVSNQSTRMGKKYPNLVRFPAGGHLKNKHQYSINHENGMLEVDFLRLPRVLYLGKMFQQSGYFLYIWTPSIKESGYFFPGL